MAANILLIYLAWCLVSFGIYLTGRFLPAGSPLAFPLVLLSMAAALFTALNLIRFYAVRVEPRIAGRHRFRIFLLALALALFLGVYAVEAFTGIQSGLLACFATANLLFVASLLGFWMVFPLKRPAEILPLCLVASLADLFSVAAGPTRVFSEHIDAYYTGGAVGMPPFVDFLLVKIGLPGHIMPVFGISDWVIIVFLSAAAGKFHLDDSLFRTARPAAPSKLSRPPLFPVSCAGLISAMGLAVLSGSFIPALPFVCLVYLLVMMCRYPDMRRLTRSEIRPALVFAVVIIGLTVWAMVGRMP